MTKKREKVYSLVDILVKKGYADSKLRAESLINAREVFVDGVVVNNINAEFSNQDIDIQLFPKLFVSRAGYKLKKAIDEFQISLTGKTCIDAGSSTGGFTDCMLQYGASKVYAVDSAYNELDWKLRNDDRVCVRERTRISDLVIDEKVDFISVDLSLISIRKVLEDIKKHLKIFGEMVILIKPQYEANKVQLPEGGIIKDSTVHEEILTGLKDYFLSQNLEVLGIITSPIKGTFGNTEFLAYLKNKID